MRTVDWPGPIQTVFRHFVASYHIVQRPMLGTGLSNFRLVFLADSRRRPILFFFFRQTFPRTGASNSPRPARQTIFTFSDFLLSFLDLHVKTARSSLIKGRVCATALLPIVNKFEPRSRPSSAANVSSATERPGRFPPFIWRCVPSVGRQRNAGEDRRYQQALGLEAIFCRKDSGCAWSAIWAACGESKPFRRFPFSGPSSRNQRPQLNRAVARDRAGPPELPRIRIPKLGGPENHCVGGRAPWHWKRIVAEAQAPPELGCGPPTQANEKIRVRSSVDSRTVCIRDVREAMISFTSLFAGHSPARIRAQSKRNVALCGVAVREDREALAVIAGFGPSSKVIASFCRRELVCGKTPVTPRKTAKPRMKRHRSAMAPRSGPSAPDPVMKPRMFTSANVPQFPTRPTDLIIQHPARQRASLETPTVSD